MPEPPVPTPPSDHELDITTATLREEEGGLHRYVQDISRDLERALADVNARIAETIARRKDL